MIYAVYTMTEVGLTTRDLERSLFLVTIGKDASSGPNLLPQPRIMRPVAEKDVGLIEFLLRHG
jgi:hypothetical protein